MFKYIMLALAVGACVAEAVPAARHRRSYVAPAPLPVAAYVPAAVPAVAAVPTLTAVHSQRLIPQAPALHTVASPTTVLQTVQTGNAIVGHQHVADQVVGKTADVNGYAFKSEVRHDAPLYAAAAPVAVAHPVVAAPVPVLAAPAPVLAAPAPVLAGPAPILAAPAQVSSYTVETGHTVAHDTQLTSPLIQRTLHAPVYGSAPVVGQVPVLGAPVVAGPVLRAPLALPAYKKA